MDLTLHVADADGVINLNGIAPAGTHYTAARNENTGVVRLTPVRVLSPGAKTAPTQEQSDPEPVETADTLAPWDA